MEVEGLEDQLSYSERGLLALEAAMVGEGMARERDLTSYDIETCE